METIDSVATANDYRAAATIEDVFRSNGGSFVVVTNDVFVSLQYGPQGQTFWTRDVHAPVGTGYISPGTTGIKFKNYTVGSAAIVSANIAEEAEPPVAFGAGGQASTTPNLAVQHNGTLVGTEPILDFEDTLLDFLAWTVTDDGPGTRIKASLPRIIAGRIKGSDGSTLAGTGFACVRNSAGNYTVSFTTALTTLIAINVSQGFNAGANAGEIAYFSQGVGGFRVDNLNQSFSPADPVEFSFVVLGLR